MRNLSCLISGLAIGAWISWPGIIFIDNWKCFFDIVEKSREDKISLKAVLAVSPRFILKGERNNNSSKLRIVSDACFR